MNQLLAPSQTSASGQLDVTGWSKIQEFWVARPHFDAGRLPANMPFGRDPEGPDWLAELHRSHRPFSGPYSICVHRPDAATVSYTELVLNSRLISMHYVDGSPCETSGFHHVVDLPRPLGQSPRRAPLSCHASAYRPWSSAGR